MEPFRPREEIVWVQSSFEAAERWEGGLVERERINFGRGRMEENVLRLPL